MKKKKVATKFLALTLAFTTALSLTGCKNTKPASEQITDITEAFKSGDSELFYKSMEDNKKFNSYFDAVNNKTNSGFGAVYVKLNEKAQGITLELNKDDDSFDVPVTVTSYDAYTAAIDKMCEAAIEGPEAFADMPTWLSAALDDAETKTETITFDARTDTNTLKYTFGPNKDFFNAITCGLYDLMNTTMTTCGDDEYATCLISKGDDIIFSADYYYMSVEDYGLSDEEVQQFIDEMSAEYNGYDGVASDIQYDGQQITQVVLIDYNTASYYDLAQLGIISSPNIDGISLKYTIEGLEEDGLTCVTETFGITSDDEAEK